MSTYTSSLGLELITPGSQAGLWGNTTNNTFTLIDQAITGVTPISFASASGSTYTLTDFNGAEDESRSAVLNITGSASGANTVVIPNKQKTYLVRNNTGQDVTFQTPSPTASYTVGAGYSILIFCDGNNNVFTGIASPGVGTLSVNAGGTGATTFTAGFIKSTGGTNALTSSSTVNLASEVTGTLTVANGGTGVTSFTSGAVLLGNGTGGISTVTGGTAGYVLTWNGSNWAAAPSAASGITTITAGAGINVSGTTNVTVTNVGVTSLTAGTGISLSASTGGITVTNTGPTLSGTNTWSGTNTFGSTVYATAAGTATPAFQTNLAGLTSFLTPSSLQIRSSGAGLIGAPNAMTMASPSGQYIEVNDGAYIQISGSTAYKPGGGTWTATSDARLKENVEPLTGALNKISLLNPVTFKWKIDNGNEPTTGFVAQEVEQVMPSAIGKRDPSENELDYISDKVLGIGWQNDMIAYLVGAIKELKAEVDALKAAK